MDIEDLVIVTVTVTCTTPGCINHDIPITFEVPVDTPVACGCCRDDLPIDLGESA